jgi:hypothetical protein
MPEVRLVRLSIWVCPELARSVRRFLDFFGFKRGRAAIHKRYRNREAKKRLGEFARLNAV